MMLGSALFLGLSCLTCAHQVITAPDGQKALTSLVPAASDSACRVIRVQLTGGPQVIYPNRTTCGTGLTLISGGTPSLVDGDNRTVRIPLRVLNRGSDPMLEPVRVIYTPGAVEVIGSGSPGDVSAHLGDSVLAGGELLWLVGTNHTIATGDSTAAKNIYIKLDSPTADAKVALGVEAMAEGGFPAVAPDSTPTWFAHDSSWTGQRILKRVVVIRFKPNTSQSQRQAVIDSVGGTVVGGLSWGPGMEGSYYVRIPPANTSSLLLSAITILERQSPVDHAGLYSPLARHWVRPNDGTGWKSAQWKVDADSSDGINWWLEDVRAPLAWGCATDASPARVAVIEGSFRPGPYAANAEGPLPPRSTFLAGTPFGDDGVHGSLVGTILADPGNDDSAGVGMAWRARIRFVADTPFYFRGSEKLAVLIQQTAQSGIKIINLSVGAAYDDSFPALNASRAKTFRYSMFAALNELPTSKRPLLVFSAGNDRRNVRDAGLDSVRTIFPNNVLIVGASTRRVGPVRDRWGGANFAEAKNQGSNYGDLIDVYAPGHDVSSWDDSLQVFRTDTGTSVSAPIVTGIAALMLAGDTTLTPQEIKQLIVAAATARGTQMANHAGKYLVDAYGALRRVSERQQSSLCGNRVWTENLSTIKVRRGTSVEVLYTSPDTIGVLFIPHGGRRIQFPTYSNGAAGLYRSLDYSPGGWIFSPGTSTFPDSLSGTTWSLFRRTHDADSATGPAHFDFYGANTSRPTGSFAITLGTSSQSGRTLFSDQRSLALPGNFISTRRDAKVDTTGAFLGYVERTEPQFQKATNTYQQMNIVPVPSPLNDRVYFAVNRYSYPVISQTDWAPGPNATPIGNEWSYQERYINRNFVSLDTELWSVPWAGGAAQMHWGRGGKTIKWFGLAESSGSTGHEAVMAIGTIDALAAGPFVGGFVQCDIEYMMIAQQTPTESPRSAPPTTCDIGGIEIPQIAPLKVGPRGFDPLQRPIPRIR
jgi:hypothetical protein